MAIPDAEIASGVQSFERSTIGGQTDVDANCFVEDAQLGEHVQVGPNASIVGVTHDLDEGVPSAHVVGSGAETVLRER